MQSTSIPCSQFHAKTVIWFTLEKLNDHPKPEKKNILEISETLSQNPQISKITPQHLANTQSVFSIFINLHHDIDWNNSQILKFETDYRKRRFIESFFINNVPNTMNDRKNDKTNQIQ